MPMITLGQGMPDMSRLVYGCWRLSDSADSSPQAVATKIGMCLDQGITTFDHADIYGGYVCEELFGAALARDPGLKQRIQVVTKCGIMLQTPAFPDRRVKYYDTSAAHIRASAETSLRRLGLDVVDLMLIHRPDPFMDHEETGAALDALVDDGLVRGIGVSNFMPWDFDLLQSAMKHPLLTNQIEISLLEHGSFTNGQIAQLQMKGISPMAWSPLAGGALFDASNPAGARLSGRLAEIAGEHHVSSDAVALAWVMAHPSNIMPIVGTNNHDRIAKIADSLKVGFDRELWYELWVLAEGKDVP
ncbi:aldo/keto reductase [Oricola sp.]|uniref:aldo/keto reductase n=1 Tax=Oricola sp. TaxID=1979950 RepID=UPI0025E3118C|nr:aldo/keto reductase [Oricola sp.]MCI5077117.1 aldo/keto reductase [Oricola sp.]